MEQQSTEMSDYAEFEEKVRRTVYIDNISPQVTAAVLRTALNQFGNVTNIQFIPNYTMNIPNCALVEMKTKREAQGVITELSDYPFMMAGMPRPVRALPAKAEMFDDHPARPGRRIFLRWMDPKEPNFQVAQKMKELTKKHAAEASFMLEHQLKEEEKLATHQAKTLLASHGKLEMIDKVFTNGAVNRLSHKYGTGVSKLADE